MTRNKQIYRITVNDLQYMVNESVIRVLNEGTENEAFLGINFGKKFRQENKALTQKYAGLFCQLYDQVKAIAEELGRRAEILDQIQKQRQASGQVQPVNEGYIGTLIKSIGRFGFKRGTKAAYKLAGKQLGKRVGALTFGAMAVELSQVPEIIGRRVEQFRNPSQVQTSEVIAGYGELAEWMQVLCEITKTRPEILGAYALKQEIYSGPQDPKNGPFMTKGEMAGAGISLGLYALTPVTFGISGIIAILWDTIDIAGMLFASKARRENEALKMVEKQYEYLNKAVRGFSQVLAKTSNSAVLQNIKSNGESYAIHTGQTSTNVNGKTVVTSSDELDRPFMVNK